MYGGYQGAYGAYGSQQYAAAANAANAANRANAYQQGHPQPAQNYYTGVNPYANYGYGGVNAPLPPPPPPPPAPQTNYGSTYSSFPSQATKMTAPGAYFKKAQSTPSNQGAFNGYDAAVYNYAQQTTQSAQNTANHIGATWNNTTGGAAGRNNKQSSGDNNMFYCETCKVSCAGAITYREHLDGKGHKKREECLKTGKHPVSLAKHKLSYRCELCDVTCTGQDTYNAHIKGGKHIKTANLHKKMGKYVPEDVPTIIAPGVDGPIETKAKPKWHQQQIPGTKKVIGINTVQFVGGHKLNSTGQLEEKKRVVALTVGSAGKKEDSGMEPIIVEDEMLQAMIVAEEIQPVGAEYVMEDRDATGKLVQFHCKLCDCKFSDPNAKEIHIKGRRHRMSYKQQVDPTLIVDQKPSNKKSDKGAKKGMDYLPMKFKCTVVPPTPKGREMNIVDDRTVDQKYQSLHPGKEYNDNIDRFLADVKSCFKMVSDKIGEVSGESTSESEVTTAQTPTNGKTNNPRILIGCIRCGPFSKKTYIKADAYADMVLTCTPLPTPELVQRMTDTFREVSTDLTIESDPTSGVCVIISANYFPELKCRVMITSPSLRSEEDSEGAKSEFPEKAMCLNALAMIRSTKWYEQLELLVSNVIDSTPSVLNPAEAFKRVIEAISSGYLHSAILNDPCESTSINVLDALSDEQKHSLTCSAQSFIRKIGFNKIHEVLGIDRLVDVAPGIPTKKRPFDTSSRDVIGEMYDEMLGYDGPVIDPRPPGVGKDFVEEDYAGIDQDDGEPQAKRGKLDDFIEEQKMDTTKEEANLATETVELMSTEEEERNVADPVNPDKSEAAEPMEEFV
ncbi:hypothetical protein CRE_20798 [Caenorhabditis remanei]|uniref:DZF domain-containing protein n=1 Tax=Caenorhabditis remanei TaxID=31234 RepID=E3MFL6_CAERE|nr:hypothetical protein CRE_20798 [Caenorhabditis remanei]